jgi:hypothetical protein
MSREIDQGEGEVSPAGWVLPDRLGKTGLTGFPNWSDQVTPSGLSRGVSGQESLVQAMAFLVQRLRGSWGVLSRFGLKGLLGISWTKLSWPVCQTGLTGFPCLWEAKSQKVSLTGFRNRPDRFWQPAAVSSCFPLCVLCYWLVGSYS